jgi:multiple sugar transport system permease protein
MTDHAAIPVTAATQSPSDNSEGMSYLETLPSKIVTLYIPLLIMIVVLLFPFYWMSS